MNSNGLEARLERLLEAVAPTKGLIYTLDLRKLCQLAGQPVSAPAGLEDANRQAKKHLKRGDAGAVVVVTLWDDRPALTDGETERQE